MDTLTDRQFIALYLYYIEGQSYRKLGGVFGVQTAPAYRLVRRAKSRLLTLKVEQGGNTSPLVERLIEPSPPARCE